MTVEDPRDPRESRAEIRTMLLIGAVVSAVGIAVALAIDWFPIRASKQGEQIDTLWDVLLIASVPIFVLVETIVLYSAIKFRMRPGEELKDGPPIHGNTRLEIIWTAIPAILLVGLCTYAYIVLTDIEKAPAAEPMNVRVVGQQFTWTFYYKGEDGKEIASPRLYLPANQPVYFTVQSKDVIHDFWVPAFRMKIDAVPGITTHYRVTPNKINDYPIVCAELCGLGHATMRATAVVESEAKFDEFLQTAANPPTPTPAAGGEAPDGKQLFASNCGGCHTLADAGTNGSAGPKLDEVLPGMDVAAIRTAIADPGAEVVDGFSNIMPGDYEQKLGAAGVDALAEYLSEVTKGG